MSHVYLAGPIAGVPGQEATDWRVVVMRCLWRYNIATRNPMRAKQQLSEQATISRDFHEYAMNGAFFTSRGIMTRDFNDVKTSSVLLVNLLGAKTPSLGTIMELAWAFALQIPAVVVIEDTGNPHDNHPMIHEAISFRVNTLAEGIHSVAVILGKDCKLEYVHNTLKEIKTWPGQSANKL